MTDEPATPRRSTGVRGHVRFDDVHFTYGTGAEVLHGIDLDVAAGHDGRARRPHRRRQVDDREADRALLRPDRAARSRRRHRPPRACTQESLRRQLGIVPQEGFLFAGTVADNIAFGRPGATREEIVAAARAVGADEFIEQLEEGYDTELGERGFRLSLGQRQLVAFARALLADPRILILDEATSSVDIGTERRIEHALRRLLHGRTAFIIAHRLSTDPRRANLIVVLEHGVDRRAGHARGAARARRPLRRALRQLGGRGRRRVARDARPRTIAIRCIDRRVVLERAGTPTSAGSGR